MRKRSTEMQTKRIIIIKIIVRKIAISGELGEEKGSYGTVNG